LKQLERLRRRAAADLEQIGFVVGGELNQVGTGGRLALDKGRLRLGVEADGVGRQQGGAGGERMFRRRHQLHIGDAQADIGRKLGLRRRCVPSIRQLRWQLSQT
jgi:hypothetical protein